MTPNQGQFNQTTVKKSKLPYIIGCSVLFIGFILLLLFAAALGYLYFNKDSFFKSEETNSEYFGKTDAPQAKTLRYGVNDDFKAEDLDPHNTPPNKILTAIFDGLAEYNNENNKLTPSLATKWEKNADATVWTFYLRKDAKWSDGKPITAKDFVYSWKRALNPENRNLVAFLLFDVKNAEEYNKSKASAEDVGLKAIDDNTFEVTLEKPTIYFDKFIADTSLRLVPQEAIEKYGSKWIEPENIVTSGAFKLAQPMNDNEILLVKNDQFWDSDNVSLENLNFYMKYDDVIEKYKDGEIDAVMPSALQLEKLADINITAKKDFSMSKILGIEFIYLNTNNKPLDNVKVRNALSLAIDRQELKKVSEFPTSVFVPQIEGYKSPEEPEFDPTKAKQLLSEAGYPNGEGIAEIEYVYNLTETNVNIAKFVQEQWEKNLGIKTQLKSMEWRTYLAYRSEGKFTGFARGGWISDYADPYSFLSLITMPESIKLWEDEKYIELLNKANTTVDPTKRYELLSEAEKYLLEQQAVIPFVKGLSINSEDKINWREVSIDENLAVSE